MKIYPSQLLNESSVNLNEDSTKPANNLLYFNKIHLLVQQFKTTITTQIIDYRRELNITFKGQIMI